MNSLLLTATAGEERAHSPNKAIYAGRLICKLRLISNDYTGIVRRENNVRYTQDDRMDSRAHIQQSYLKDRDQVRRANKSCGGHQPPSLPSSYNPPLLLRLEGLGALAPPAGPDRARPPNAIW